MDARTFTDDEWACLVTLLPQDLDDAAFNFGALVRKREVRTGAELLRLAFAYGFGGRSLRDTAAWARASGIARISDVGLLKRLRGCADWLAELLSEMLASRAGVALGSGVRGLRLRLVDATAVSRKGSEGTDFRVHLGYDLVSMRMDRVEVTDASGGETFARLGASEGEVLVGDRGYAHRAGICFVANRGAHVVVRLPLRNVPLVHPDGSALNRVQEVSSLAVGEISDVRCRTASGRGLASVAGRLVAVRKSPETAERARRQARLHAKRQGRNVGQDTLIAAGFVFLFTTLPVELASAGDVLEIYRLRWQIELTFKRMKGIFGLDELAARDERLCRTFLLSKLLATVLVEELSRAEELFSPWGYGPPRVAVASPTGNR